MNGFLARLHGAVMTPAPAQRLAVVRIAVGAFVCATAAGLLPSTLTTPHLDIGAFRPVGLLLAWPRPPLPAFALAVNALTVAMGAAVACGWRHAVTGPAAALLFTWIASYRSSWGMIFHSENLLALHAWVVAFAPAADVWSLDARRRGIGAVGEESSRYGWPLSLLAVLTTAAYFMAGVAKLRAEGIGWAGGAFLRDQIAYDNVRKAELGAFHSPLGGALLANPILFAPLATLSLGLEVLAPLALLSRRLLQGWSIAIVAFHLGILALMAVAFPYPLTGAAFIGFFPVERAVLALHRRLASGSG